MYEMFRFRCWDFVPLFFIPLVLWSFCRVLLDQIVILGVSQLRLSCGDLFS